jgi:hypothetical protein
MIVSNYVVQTTHKGSRLNGQNSRHVLNIIAPTVAARFLEVTPVFFFDDRVGLTSPSANTSSGRSRLKGINSMHLVQRP